MIVLLNKFNHIVCIFPIYFTIKTFSLTSLLFLTICIKIQIKIALPSNKEYSDKINEYFP